jgi:cytochrome c-type biogenesis protein CcmH
MKKRNLRQLLNGAQREQPFARKKALWMEERMRKILARYSWRILLAAAAVALILTVTPGQAQSQPPTDDEVNAVAKQMYCPVCENTPLDVCPTTACAQWRDLIREKLSAGWTDDQIKQYFAVQYGDRVLSEPPRRGLNWLIYVLPPVLIAGGAVLVYLVMRSMRRKGTQTVAAAQTDAPVSDEYMQRLEEELHKREQES